MAQDNVDVKRMSNREVADILEDVSDILQILDANRFKIIAFQNAAEALRTLGQDVNSLHDRGELQTIPGVGKGIAKSLDELLNTGQVAEFEEFYAQVPRGVVEMVRIPDVGPKTARRLWEELDITSVDELRAAAEEERIRDLKGFGAKSEQKILRGIELAAQRGDERTPSGEARPLAEAIVRELQDGVGDAIDKIEIAGSLRRWRETIGDLDILVVSSDRERVIERFSSLPQVSDVIGRGGTKCSVVLATGLQADLRVVEPQNWGAALQYFTGSKEHNVTVRELAQRQGWSLNEYGLTSTGTATDPSADGEPSQPETVYFETEQALYEFLGLAWVPPEMRENRGEVQAAREHKLPILVTLEDIRGELHGHTDWSDGHGTIEQMAAAAMARGYAYWNVADHSTGLGMVGGLDAERIAEQGVILRKMNESWQADGVDFRLLRGSEVEVLADGTLGLEDEVLAQLDVVVASIHSGLRQDRETITERCLKAIRNPHVDILGHPTGRIIGSRPPSEIDMERVLQACAQTGTLVEINAHPSRLDVNDVYARRAVELGCKIAINSDAHATDGMEIMDFGIGVARRAWLQAADVVNTYPLSEMLGLLKGGK